MFDNNFYRHALHDLHEIPGGIFSRQRAEARSGTSLDGIDVPAKSFARERVNFYGHRLPGLHVGELCFLEIRSHPHIGVDKHEHGLARLQVVAWLDRALRHPALVRSENAAITEVYLSPLYIRL